MRCLALMICAGLLTAVLFGVGGVWCGPANPGHASHEVRRTGRGDARPVAAWSWVDSKVPAGGEGGGVFHAAGRGVRACRTATVGAGPWRHPWKP